MDSDLEPDVRTLTCEPDSSGKRGDAPRQRFFGSLARSRSLVEPPLPLIQRRMAKVFAPVLLCENRGDRRRRPSFPGAP